MKQGMKRTLVFILTLAMLVGMTGMPVVAADVEASEIGTQEDEIVNLAVPQNVHEENDFIVWDEVEGAVRYNIKIYKNDENHTLYIDTYNNRCRYQFQPYQIGEYWVTVQAMDEDYHVSEWTKEILAKVVEKPRLAAPQNIRFDESGENIIWDEVEGADYYFLNINASSACKQPILENWKRYISPWDVTYNGKWCIHVCAASYSNNIASSYDSEELEFEYIPPRDESITVPQIQLNNGIITWDKSEKAFRYECRILVNGHIYIDYHYPNGKTENLYSKLPEGNYEIELCEIDEDGKYNSKIYPFTLDTIHDESVWVPKLYHEFNSIIADYDSLRYPDTDLFWIRIRKKQDGTVVKLENRTGVHYGLGDLKNGNYKIDVCVRQNDGKIGKWSEPMEIEKHGVGLFEKENEITTELEVSHGATDVTEEDRVRSITINPAFNMKHKNGSNAELDRTKIKIKAKEIYDEEGVKRAETALGETLNGNKHYNLLDLTLLYDGKDFSNDYDGLVKVIIPLPKGHRDKTFSCYRLNGKNKELIPGEQTEDSYIIYLEHFSEYALVAAGLEEPHIHAYRTDWKSNSGFHWKECYCGESSALVAHIEDNGIVIKEPSETETGIKTYKCTVCGYVMRTEQLDKLGVEEPSTSSSIPPSTEPSESVSFVPSTSPSIPPSTEPSAGVSFVPDTSPSIPPSTVPSADVSSVPDISSSIPPSTEPSAGVSSEPNSPTPKPNVPIKIPNISKKEFEKNSVQMNKKSNWGWNGNSLTVKWGKVSGASGYDIYAAVCGTSFNKITLSVKNKNKTTAVIKRVAGKKVSKKKTYKVRVYAYRFVEGKKQYIGKSADLHVAGSKNQKYTNAKNIKLSKKKYTLHTNETVRIRAKIVMQSKKKKLLPIEHGANLRYSSSDTSVATVSKTGLVKPKKKGSCVIYIHALNGVNKQVSIIIK